MNVNRTKLILAMGSTVALLAACSSSKATPSTAPTSAAAANLPAAKVTPATSSASAASTSRTKTSLPVADPGLSGRWKGTYKGAYTGTFVLRWTQSTAKLAGTIDLSTAPGAIPINGTVVGGRIRFGTVGSQAITYTGSVSGRSMSGRYEIAGGAGGSGTWSATRG